jgi:hypothetical protein
VGPFIFLAKGVDTMAVTTAFQSDNERLNDDQKKRLNAIHEKYNAPGTSEATKKILNEAANMIRAEAGYTGGTSGNTPTPIKKTKTPKTIVEEEPVYEEPPANDIDIAEYMEDYKNALRKERLNALDKARNNALSALSEEESTIAPRYDTNRRQAVASNDMTSKSLAEYLAKRGLRSGGAASQVNLANSVALQNNMGEINRGETAAMNDISRRRTDVETGYQTDRSSINAGIDATVLPMMINQLNADRQFAYQQGRDAVSDSRYDTNFEYQQGRDAIEDQRYKEEQEWARSENNPSVRAQILNNMMSQIEIDAANNPNSYENQRKNLELQRIKQDIAQGSISMERARFELNNLKKGLNSDGSVRQSSTNDPSFTATQYLNQAKDMLNQTVSTGQNGPDGKPIMRPKYTRQQFESWLATIFPNTPEGDMAYDEVVRLLNLDYVDFYEPQNFAMLDR